MQIKQAEQLTRELLDGATVALYDADLAAAFREALQSPSIDKLTNDFAAKNFSGESLFNAVLDKMKEPLGKFRLVTETGACFIAGTLVHTKDGPVPIEKLKVGDWVLSAPENGEGERAYKRVVKTMVRHDQPIMQVLYKITDENNPTQTLYKRLTSTYDHPFWTDEEGWTSARMLGGSYIGPSRVRLADGSRTDLEGKVYIYCTDRPGVGWVAEDGRQGEGWQWDYDNGRRAVDGRMGYDSDKWAASDDDMYLPFRTTVYNIEIEDYHTYFVGEHGVWVHNANCDGVKFG